MRYLTPPEKLTDQTVRRHWQEATKVNIKGERVSIDPEGPLAQAQWVKDPLRRGHPDPAERLLPTAAAAQLR